MKKLVFLLLMTGVLPANPQELPDTSASELQLPLQNDTSTKTPFTISAYIELYYAYDFGRPADHSRPAFVYSYNRHNELALNLGYIHAAYSTANLRANLGLMAGTYANANLAAEPPLLRQVYEANAGLKLLRKHSLWLDAGIMPSHIGFESAIGKDCWTLSRSIIADNSPYYEAGVKISYTSKNDRWYLACLLLNGWQRMQRVAGNNTPAVGTQITWKPNGKLTLNSSTFIGNDKPDSLRQMRYFHNMFAILRPCKKLGLSVGVDYGWEQERRGSADYNSWYGWVAIVRYQVLHDLATAVRAEHYDDRQNVIVSQSAFPGFKCSGLSLNVDYQVRRNAMLRLEGKAYQAKDKLFTKGSDPSKGNAVLSAVLAVSL